MASVENNETKTNPENNENQTVINDSQEGFQQREKELQASITEYEKTLAQEKSKVTSLQTDLKNRTQERDDLKKQVSKLETELTKQSLKGGNDANSKDMVTNARGVIFEKTKMCKNQELQIEALTQQVVSLKEIVGITKDMLDIRNTEVNQLKDKLDCMELKFTVEKDRQALMHAKMEKMIKLNVDLKVEYEKQLKLFSDLQEQYHKRMAVADQTNGHAEQNGDN